VIGDKKPLVSVIIPAYNHEAWIKETILSIVNQSYNYKNIQLIVADDCSTDNTVLILNELAKKYDFKLLKHNENIGLTSTINEMISISKGQYLIIIASDDVMLLSRIENQVEILNRNPDIDILAGDNILIDEVGKVITRYDQNPLISLTQYSFEDLFLRLKPGFAAGTAIIKNNLFQRIGTYDSNLKIEDYYFWLKAASHRAKIVKCNIPFLYYRVHHKSLSSNWKLLDLEVIKILSTYRSHPKYYIAIKSYEISKLSRMVLIRKRSALYHLLKNPKLFFSKKIIIILVMVVLPTYILKLKFPEYYYKYVSS
jgi:alpha-1,3-rhamnosyltransferase